MKVGNIDGDVVGVEIDGTQVGSDTLGFTVGAVVGFGVPSHPSTRSSFQSTNPGKHSASVHSKSLHAVQIAFGTGNISSGVSNTIVYSSQNMSSLCAPEKPQQPQLV